MQAGLDFLPLPPGPLAGTPAGTTRTPPGPYQGPPAITRLALSSHLFGSRPASNVSLEWGALESPNVVHRIGLLRDTSVCVGLQQIHLFSSVFFGFVYGSRNLALANLISRSQNSNGPGPGRPKGPTESSLVIPGNPW